MLLTKRLYRLMLALAAIVGLQLSGCTVTPNQPETWGQVRQVEARQVEARPTHLVRPLQYPADQPWAEVPDLGGRKWIMVHQGWIIEGELTQNREVVFTKHRACPESWRESLVWRPTYQYATGLDCNVVAVTVPKISAEGPGFLKNLPLPLQVSYLAALGQPAAATPEVQAGLPMVYQWRQIGSTEWELKTTDLKVEAKVLAGSLIFIQERDCPSSRNKENVTFLAGDKQREGTDCTRRRRQIDLGWTLSHDFVRSLPPTLKSDYEATVKERQEAAPAPRPGTRIPRPPREIKPRSN